tara:strand:- start:2880 stop:3590 length:711 start_codon:yes stop_codon:yes gene_type:complete
METSVLTKWEQLPSGETIQSIVEQSLVTWWPRIFGYHLLKIGGLSQQLDTRLCPIHHQISADRDIGLSIRLEPSQLPFQSHSIDACILSCLLDFHVDPLRVLREVDRCLVPAGHLLLIGFNPMSPLMIGNFIPSYRQKPPWQGNFFMPSRIKDWLALLGYQLIHDERLVYHHLLTPLSINSSGQRMLENIFPTTGALYLMIARKLNVPLTSSLIKSRLKKKAWIPAAQVGRNTNMG